MAECGEGDSYVCTLFNNGVDAEGLLDLELGDGFGDFSLHYEIDVALVRPGGNRQLDGFSEDFQGVGSGVGSVAAELGDPLVNAFDVLG